MTAPTDHLALARAALDDARGTGPIAALHLARAQVHATIALAEEARTTNLIRSLDDSIVIPRADVPEIVGTTMSGDAEWYTFADGRARGILVSDEHYDRAVAYLAAHEYEAAHPPVPPVDEAQVEALADLLDDTQNYDSRQLARRLLATGKVTVRQP